jgi:hypothetical protein
VEGGSIQIILGIIKQAKANIVDEDRLLLKEVVEE